MGDPTVLLEAYGQGDKSASYLFAEFCGAVVAHSTDQVKGAIEQVAAAVEQGLHGAGFIAYEAARGLDPVLPSGVPASLPLVWFGLFRRRIRVESGNFPAGGSYDLGPWEASLEEEAYGRKLAGLQRHISAGDTYQVNFTWRLRADFSGDPRTFYRQLCLAQPAAYNAFIDLGDQQILSASPELFFSLDKDQLITRPMKGTRPRGRWAEEDQAVAEELAASAKDRAENVMIVDLLRNDLGRIAQSGTVEVPHLWQVESYPTVWQMTSTVRARLRPEVGLTGVLTALFPCGSVTGAPKVRTMELIDTFEEAPRGVYTGCIGFVSPGRQARFSVAIRTVWIDGAAGRAEFGVGSGITHYSVAGAEYAECLAKARLLAVEQPEFSLVETLLYEGGYFLLDRHLQRLKASAGYFSFPYRETAVRQALDEQAAELAAGAYRVRLQLDPVGGLATSGVPLEQGVDLSVGLAAEAVDSSDPFLFHKTTHRQVYQKRREAHGDWDEVILSNERGELTECSIGNLVLELEGRRWTPPQDCGLLAGTFRAELLENGQIAERVLYPQDLKRASGIYMVNSLRRWVPLRLVETE